MYKVRSREPGGYFEWLMGYVGVFNGWHGECDDLLWQLHSIDFRYSIRNDVNRLSDGMKMRDIFLYEKGGGEMETWPCSVLEVLVGLARVISEDVLGNDGNQEVTYFWFWKMIENLGLLKFTGGKRDRGRVCSIVEAWIGRNFEADGTGSPFPIKNPRPGVDQRWLEIWAQVCGYIDENVDVKM